MRNQCATKAENNPQALVEECRFAGFINGTEAPVHTEILIMYGHRLFCCK